MPPGLCSATSSCCFSPQSWSHFRRRLTPRRTRSRAACRRCDASKVRVGHLPATLLGGDCGNPSTLQRGASLPGAWCSLWPLGGLTSLASEAGPITPPVLLRAGVGDCRAAGWQDPVEGRLRLPAHKGVRGGGVHGGMAAGRRLKMRLHCLPAAPFPAAALPAAAAARPGRSLEAGRQPRCPRALLPPACRALRRCWCRG